MDDSTSSSNGLCVDSGLASFCTFSGIFTPEGGLCRSQAPWYGRSVASIPSCDKIPIVSLMIRRTTRLESCPTIRPWLTSGVVSPLSPSSHPPDLTLHPSSAIRHLPSAIRHPASAICSLSSAIRHLPSVFSASPFPVPHSEFRILRRVSSVRISSRCRADWYRRCRSNAGLQSSAARSYRSSASSASICSCPASSSSSRPTCRSMIEQMRISAAFLSLGSGAIWR